MTGSVTDATVIYGNIIGKDLREIPDQLHEKLSLGLLGWEAIVCLDWELDKDVPGTNVSAEQSLI